MKNKLIIGGIVIATFFAVFLLLPDKNEKLFRAINAGNFEKVKDAVILAALMLLLLLFQV